MANGPRSDPASLGLHCYAILWGAGRCSGLVRARLGANLCESDQRMAGRDGLGFLFTASQVAATTASGAWSLPVGSPIFILHQLNVTLIRAAKIPALF
jgi:hypothetical protein